MRIGNFIKTMAASRYWGVMLFGRWSLYVSRGKMRSASPSSEVAHRREYKNFRKRIFMNRPHMCECCGETDLCLELHHIVSIKDNPALAMEDSNVRLLCHECHMIAHGKGTSARKIYTQSRTAGDVDYEYAVDFVGAF